MFVATALLLLSASSAPASPFTINLNVVGGLTPSQQAVFSTAATTWMGLLPQYQPGISIAALAISLEGIAIDGVGGALAQAGPTSSVSQGGYVLATHGVMQFDTADLGFLESNGILLNWVLHEMAHVIGFGTLWTPNGVYTANSGQFTGANALATYRIEFSQPAATFVPVELFSGGTNFPNAHWDENDGGSCCTGRTSAQGDMTFELMTGWLNAGAYLSQTSMASFFDIGYLPVPEPGSFWLLGAGMTVLGLGRRRGPTRGSDSGRNRSRQIGPDSANVGESGGADGTRNHPLHAKLAERRPVEAFLGD
jgi:hypothetical protein